MRTFVMLGLTALVTAACQDATGPRDPANLGRGQTAGVVGRSTLSLLNALGAATPATQFSVFGSGGTAILSSQFVGPEFNLTQPTTITEIGGFVNNCGDIGASDPFNDQAGSITAGFSIPAPGSPLPRPAWVRFASWVPGPLHRHPFNS